MSDEAISSEELAELRKKAGLYDHYTESNRSFADREAERGVVYFSREHLQVKLPIGWRLVHYETGSSAKPERYSAAKEGSTAMQSAGSQEELIRRCEAWDARQASLKQPAAASVSIRRDTVAAGPVDDSPIVAA